MVSFRNYMPWYSIGEQVDRFRRDFGRILGKPQSDAGSLFSAFNLYRSEEGVVLVAELPGVEITDIELTVTGASAVIKGARKEIAGVEGGKCVRRERLSGEFTRSFELPYRIDAAKAEATIRKGVLRIDLPRAESDKPRRITVQTAS